MFREAMIKLGGATLLLLGIGFFTLGVISENKFTQATGFMASIIAVALLYYAWMMESSRPLETEPEEKMPIVKQ